LSCEKERKGILFPNIGQRAIHDDYGEDDYGEDDNDDL
jgi:hypothetical protein